MLLHPCLSASGIQPRYTLVSLEMHPPTGASMLLKLREEKSSEEIEILVCALATPYEPTCRGLGSELARAVVKHIGQSNYRIMCRMDPSLVQCMTAARKCHSFLSTLLCFACHLHSTRFPLFGSVLLRELERNYSRYTGSTWETNGKIYCWVVIARLALERMLIRRHEVRGNYSTQPRISGLSSSSSSSSLSSSLGDACYEDNLLWLTKRLYGTLGS